MNIQLAGLPVNFCGVACLVVSTIVIAKLFQRSKINNFPAAGSNNWLGSWWAGLRSITNAQSLLQAAYKKHNPAPFRFSDSFFWTVVLSGRKHVEELARASDQDFSFREAVQARIQTKYTLGYDVVYNPYHVGILRSHLTRNLELLYPGVIDEITTSFDDLLNLSGNEWKSVPALDLMDRIICRVSNRALVGLPLCRDPDWLDLMTQFNMHVIRGGLIVWLFPRLLKPLAVRFLTNIPQSRARCLRLLRPVIEERRKHMDEYGKNWDNKPDDFLTWLMDEAEGPERTAERLTKRVLFANFAAIKTTANAITYALFYLAANPQYAQPLREEVEGTVENDGWTRIALSKMRKVDSFLKECVRVEGFTLISMPRMALRDFTFSDGTLIPKGTVVTVASHCLHHDERNYTNPDTFEPFRFADLHEEEGKGETYQLASATTSYLPFGLGKYACVGRFFAAAEMKFILAHVVVTYDVKLEDNATRPLNLNMGTFVGANPHAKVVFRNRV